MIPEAVAISSVFFTKNSKFDLLEFGQECKRIALLKHNFTFNQSFKSLFMEQLHAQSQPRSRCICGDVQKQNLVVRINNSLL